MKNTIFQGQISRFSGSRGHVCIYFKSVISCGFVVNQKCGAGALGKGQSV